MKGKYILNVKSNQKRTLLELEEHLKPFYKKEILKTENQSANHGRIETRIRCDKKSAVEKTDVSSYYISYLKDNKQVFNIIREH